MKIDIGYHCSIYPQETEIHSFTVKDTRLDTGHIPPAELVWALMDEFTEKLILGRDRCGCFKMKLVYKRPGESGSEPWGVVALEVEVTKPKRSNLLGGEEKSKKGEGDVT